MNSWGQTRCGGAAEQRSAPSDHCTGETQEEMPIFLTDLAAQLTAKLTGNT
jgi:hypothetical protein